MPRIPVTAASARWPSDRQQLLLQAALWQDERALWAWDQWRNGTTREQVSGPDGRLLATAYRPLRALGADDPLLTIAGGLCRRAWFANQLSIQRAAKVVQLLDGAGIEALVLKGTALALTHYPEIAARPMADVDLLLRPESFTAGVEAVIGDGWRVVPGQGQGPLSYGLHVEDESGFQIDLHQFALMQSADDRDLWETRVPLTLGSIDAYTLGPAEQLLHICVHGMRWHPGAPAHWAADATMIVRSAGDVLDWERLIERAQARRVTVTVSRALEWLRGALEVEVPGWVLPRLSASRKLALEGAVDAVCARPHTPATFAVLSLDRYRRFAKLAPAPDRPANFRSYLQSAWGLQSTPDLVLAGGRKLLGRSG